MNSVKFDRYRFIEVRDQFTDMEQATIKIDGKAISNNIADFRLESKYYDGKNHSLVLEIIDKGGTRIIEEINLCYPRLIGDCDNLDVDHISGWILDPLETNRSLTFELLCNDEPIVKFSVNQFRKSLKETYGGSGNYSFHFHTPTFLITLGPVKVELRELLTGFLVPNSETILSYKPKQLSNYEKITSIKEKIKFVQSVIPIFSLLNLEDENLSKLKSKKYLTPLLNIEDKVDIWWLKKILIDIYRDNNNFRYLGYKYRGEIKLIKCSDAPNNYYQNFIGNLHDIVFTTEFVETNDQFSIINFSIKDINSHVLRIEDSYGTSYIYESPYVRKKSQEFAPSSHRRLSNLVPLKVEFIIPVYRRYDMLVRLLESMQLDNKFILSGSKVLVANDDPYSDDSLFEDLRRKYPWVNVLSSDTNLGYLKNCNRAYEQSSGDIVVLVNTDIEFPRYWFSRLLLPFADDDVGLATPLATDGENLSIRLPLGFSWRDVDALVSWDRRAAPNACTAIGYCLAVRRQAVGERLYDESYGHGYGEDSDLHYRMVTSGWKSVVIQNLVVNHEHGASYSIHAIDRNKLRQENHYKFIERWGNEHSQAIKKFNKLVENNYLPVLSDNFSEHLFMRRRVNVLFVSPSQNRKYGGIKVIFKLAEDLQRHGLGVAIVLDGEGNRYKPECVSNFNVYDSWWRVTGTINKIDVIVSTGFDTIFISEFLANYFNARHLCLCQGPEFVFSGGKYFSFYDAFVDYPDRFICVSDYLADLLKLYYRIDSESLRLGPNSLVFFESSLAVRQRAVVISLNSTLEKGTGFALLAAKLFHARGYKVKAFGTFDGMVPSWIESLGWCDEATLAELFNEAKFFIESSYYEGLGLLALEAAKCGCIPLVRNNGSSDKIFNYLRDILLWTNTNDLKALCDKMLSMSLEEEKTLRNSVISLAQLYDERRAFDRFKQIVIFEVLHRSGSENLNRVDKSNTGVFAEASDALAGDTHE